MKIEKITMQKYDSRVFLRNGERVMSGRSYANYTVGMVYNIHLENGSILQTGHFYYEKFCMASECDIANMLRTASEPITIPLKDMHRECQKDLAKQMGMEAFPWEESSWGNKEVFAEWDNPQTIEGKINKSLIY